MRLLAPLDLITDRNERFSYLLYTLIDVNNPTLSEKPAKGTPFGRSLSVKAIKGSTPPDGA